MGLGKTSILSKAGQVNKLPQDKKQYKKWSCITLFSLVLPILLAFCRYLWSIHWRAASFRGDRSHKLGLVSIWSLSSRRVVCSLLSWRERKSCCLIRLWLGLAFMEDRYCFIRELPECPLFDHSILLDSRLSDIRLLYHICIDFQALSPDRFSLYRQLY